MLQGGLPHELPSAVRQASRGLQVYPRQGSSPLKEKESVQTFHCSRHTDTSSDVLVHSLHALRRIYIDRDAENDVSSGRVDVVEEDTSCEELDDVVSKFLNSAITKRMIIKTSQHHQHRLKKTRETYY